MDYGRFHRTLGIPCEYFGVLGTIFIHTLRPSLEKQDLWDEDTQDAWLVLFGYMARVMSHGYKEG